MNIGLKLKNLRLQNDKTQTDMAKILNVAKSTVSMYERNQREPSADMLKKYAQTFDVTLDYLLGNERPVEGQDLHNNKCLWLYPGRHPYRSNRRNNRHRRPILKRIRQK